MGVFLFIIVCVIIYVRPRGRQLAATLDPFDHGQE